MTRKEVTGKRSLEFSQWIRTNLPNSFTSGFRVTDIDWCLYDKRNKRIMFLEEKTRGSIISNWYRDLIINFLHPLFKNYSKEFGIDYRGFHIVEFSNTNPKDGKITWHENCCKCKDAVKITEKELKEKLSLR